MVLGDEHDGRIARLAQMMEKDGLSPDEQNQDKLDAYRLRASELVGPGGDSSGLVYEALLYLKLKNSRSADPLQDGDKFGVGFS